MRFDFTRISQSLSNNSKGKQPKHGLQVVHRLVAAAQNFATVE
jgi:hypothetical protein